MKLKFNDFNKVKPENGEDVIWVWSYAGQVASGDYYNGEVRDSTHNYKSIKKKEDLPTASPFRRTRSVRRIRVEALVRHEAIRTTDKEATD